MHFVWDQPINTRPVVAYITVTPLSQPWEPQRGAQCAPQDLQIPLYGPSQQCTHLEGVLICPLFMCEGSVNEWKKPMKTVIWKRMAGLTVVGSFLGKNKRIGILLQIQTSYLGKLD